MDSGRDLRLVSEARELYTLLSGGHPRLTYYVSRTFAIRDRMEGECHDLVDAGEWRLAQEYVEDSLQPRTCNPFVLRKHLMGDYDVAIESPGWCGWLAFDVDCHVPGVATRRSPPSVRLAPERDERVPGQLRLELDVGNHVPGFATGPSPESVRLARERCDRVLGQLMDAFGLGRNEPVLLGSPSGGFHVYLPLIRTEEARETTWPAARIRAVVQRRLDAVGLELRPGVIELFPSGTALRAPCGRGMELLCSDSWMPIPGTYRYRGKQRVRCIDAMVRQFLEQWRERARTLEEWTEVPGARWHAVFGPWGDRKAEKLALGDLGGVCRSQDKEDVSPGTGPTGPHGVLRGAAFVSEVRRLCLEGLTEAGTRHFALLRLLWYWRVCCRLEVVTCLARLEQWLRAFAHVTRKNPEQFLTESRREARLYLERLSVPDRGTWAVRSRRRVSCPIFSNDEKVVCLADQRVQREVRQILAFLHGHCLDNGVVPDAVLLSSHILRELVGERRICERMPDGRLARRRAGVMAVEELIRLRVLTVDTDYSRGRHGRLYSCWYVFGSGVLPGEVLRQRLVSEGRLEAVCTERGRAIPRVRGVNWSRRSLPSEANLTPFRERWWMRSYLRQVLRPGDFLHDERLTFAPRASRFVPGAWEDRQRHKSGPRPILPEGVAAVVAGMSEAVGGAILRSWELWARAGPSG